MAISRQQFSPQSIAKLNEVVRAHEQDRGSDPSGRRQFLGGTTPLIRGTTDDTIADDAAGTMTTDAGTTMPILNRTGASLSGATQVWAHWWGAGPGYVVLPTGEGGHEPHLYGELDEELEAGMSATMSVHDAQGDTGENVTLVDNLMPDGSSFPAGTFVWASWHQGDGQWYLAAAKSCPEGGPEGGGVTDHGLLSGLGDDDHPHYSLRNGTRWTTTQNGERVAVSDASGNLVESDITTTELAALDGIEGNIEDRLSDLEDGGGGGVGPFDANRVIISDGSGDLAASSITTTELGYLDDVTSNIQTQLDGKAASSHSHAISDVTGLSAALAGKADSVHSHAISDVTGLSTALAGKADANHTHDIEDIDGLEDALDGKAASSHTHAASDITSGTFDNARIAQGNVTQHQGAIDHGSIAGLGDDDHGQYSLKDGTRWTTVQTANRVAVSDSSGNLVCSDITTTELAALDGIEGNIEERLSDLEEGGGGVTDHGDLDGLGDDDHSQYALLAGRSGGQTIIGGTGAGEALTLAGTSHGTPGPVIVGSSLETPAATITVSTTLTAAHHTVYCNNSTDIVVDVADPATCAGRAYWLEKTSNNTNLVEIEDDNGDPLAALIVQGDWVVIASDGSNWQVFTGSLAGHQCVLRRTTTQSIASTTNTQITGMTVMADVGGIAGTDEIIIKRPGQYLILVSANGPTTGTSDIWQLYAFLNGVGYGVVSATGAAISTTAGMAGAFMAALAAGDEIDLRVLQFNPGAAARNVSNATLTVLEQR